MPKLCEICEHVYLCFECGVNAELRNGVRVQSSFSFSAEFLEDGTIMLKFEKALAHELDPS